jgi:hypothetical protein
MDPITGRLNWPSALQQASFDSQREQLDQLFASRAKYGGLSYADQLAVRQTVEAMFDALKAQIQNIPPPDYMACRTFLASVTYAGSKSELE